MIVSRYGPYPPDRTNAPGGQKSYLSHLCFQIPQHLPNRVELKSRIAMG